jgi:hypothetical protein
MNFITDISFREHGTLRFSKLSSELIVVDIDGDRRCMFTRDQFKDMLILLCEILEIER